MLCKGTDTLVDKFRFAAVHVSIHTLHTRILQVTSNYVRTELRQNGLNEPKYTNLPGWLYNIELREAAFVRNYSCV